MGGSVGTGHTAARGHGWLGGADWGEGLVFSLLTPSSDGGGGRRPVLPGEGYGFGRAAAVTGLPGGGREWSLSLNGQVEAVLIRMHQAIDLHT